MILGIPDIRQKTDFSCGAAALEAVAFFFSRPAPPVLANPVQGMAPETVEAVLRSLGLRLLAGTMTVRDLRHLCNTGRPVLCPLSLHGGHWLVVRGVEGMRVFVQDPLTGPAEYTSRAFSALWSADSSHGHEYKDYGIAVSD